MVVQRVLVVDDEPSITATLSLVLSASGFEVKAANSGEEALEVAQKFGPDALITDYAMPGMDGLELAGKVIRLYPACRVLVFSGYSRLPPAPVDRWRFLTKPVPPKVFIDLLKAAEGNGTPSPSRAPRVLFIDDVDSHRYSVARLLRLAGFEVLEHTTGSEALTDSARTADVILLDVGLPDISGVEVCRILKGQVETAAIPVILLTASHMEELNRSRSMSLGAYDYITEPYDPDYLLKQVRSALQLRYLEAPEGK